MSSTDSWSVRPVRWVCFRLLICLCALGLSGSLQAQSQADYPEVWLVTYGPGELAWERFGHNVIWIRDESAQLDHVFNFGVFDFEQEAFFRRFLQGKLLYFSIAQPAEREFSAYINANRSIRAQRLDLTESESLQLADYLLTEIQPENREYLYDYYTENCSTRIAEALDLVLGGSLFEKFSKKPAGQNWRDHTRRLSSLDFWLYLGLELGLGSPIDRDISRWEEFFIPAELSTAISTFQRDESGKSRPLVVEDVMLYESTLESPPAEMLGWWPGYLLFGVLLVAAGWLAGFIPGVTAPGLARGWLVLSGAVGGMLVFFWFLTDHQAASWNLNVLLFNPFYLAFVLKPLSRFAGWALLGSSAVAVLIAVIPGGQYNWDVMAAFLPANLAAGLILMRITSGFNQAPISASKSA